MADSTGINRLTGKILTDWAHVVQSLSVIFSTRFGTRVMRRYFGSNIPKLLGENLVPESILRFYASFGVALLQEPRVRLLKMTPLGPSDDFRLGKISFLVDLEYRPRGHLGDFTPEGSKKVIIGLNDNSQLVVQEAA